MKRSSELTLLDSEPGAFAFYAWENTTLIVWAAQATGAALERLAVISATMVESCPEGVSNIHIVAHGAPLPTPEARAGFVRLMEQYEAQLACVAVVLEGSGFWAATLRSVITGMRMVSPRTFPMRFHESIEEVPIWLPQEHLKLTGVRLEPARLSGVLQSARDFIDAKRKLAR